MTKSEIFKVQKPLSGSSLESIMIYNKDRSIFSQIPMTQEIAKCMGTSYKIYVKGYVDDKGILQIEEEEVGAQNGRTTKKTQQSRT